MIWSAFLAGFNKVIPPWAWLFAALVGAFGWWGHHREALGDAAGYQRGHAEYTSLQAVMTARALAAEQGAREEEQRRAAALKEIEDAHQVELQRLRADAVIADAAAGRLQQRVAALVAAARSGGSAGNPAPAGTSPSTEDAAGVLAELQRRADERAGILARIADERGAAGAECEQRYDALTASK